MIRALTNDEYVNLTDKALGGKVGGLSPSHYFVQLTRQAHRSLAEGRKPEDLTPAEQIYAAAFEGMKCVQIPNDYGWEPGVEVAEPGAVQTSAPEPKPRKVK